MHRIEKICMLDADGDTDLLPYLVQFIGQFFHIGLILVQG